MHGRPPAAPGAMKLGPQALLTAGLRLTLEVAAMMMGRQATKQECFVSISLDDYAPQDHLLRAVDRFLDPSEFRQSLAGPYSHTGCPSIDPELMIRMLIIGYCYGIQAFPRIGTVDSATATRSANLMPDDAWRQMFRSLARYDKNAWISGHPISMG